MGKSTRRQLFAGLAATGIAASSTEPQSKGGMRYDKDGNPTWMRSKHFLAVIFKESGVTAELLTRADLNLGGIRIHDLVGSLERMSGVQTVFASRYDINIRRGRGFQWEEILPAALKLADAWVNTHCGVIQPAG